MGKGIFISYKYGDRTVHGLRKTVRNYVDDLQGLLDKKDYEDKGEPDNLDLSQFPKNEIQKELAKRMFYSSVTIVLISPNMKESYKRERTQWVPWEASYSLQTRHRKGGISKSNAMIAVVLPDANSSYRYYIEENICPDCSAITLRTDTLFPILKNNMFNIKNPEYSDCPKHEPGTIFSGESSYIESVKWNDFKANINHYIDKAIERQSNRNAYQINTRLEQ